MANQRQTTTTPLAPAVITSSGSPVVFASAQQNQAVTWVDNNTVLSFASNGNLFETNATTMGTTAKGAVSPAVPSLTSATTNLYYNTAISPYVWACTVGSVLL